MIKLLKVFRELKQKELPPKIKTKHEYVLLYDGFQIREVWTDKNSWEKKSLQDADRNRDETRKYLV